MANFAVNASDAVIAKGKDLLEKMANPGEKQGDVLERIFKIVEEHKDGETMKKGGVDIQALDSALSNIRTMFLASVTGREQIVSEKTQRLMKSGPSKINWKQICAINWHPQKWTRRRP